jgi:hypothetical protein
MKITIKNADVFTKEGISKKTNKPYTMHTQKATAETDEFRNTVELTLGDDAKPYPVGEYTIDFDRSVQVDQYGNFRFARQLVLVPLRAAAKAA